MTTRCTARGDTPENPDTAPAPTDRKLSDGQHADHWVLCEADRAKGFVRPVRMSYEHVGIPGPNGKGCGTVTRMPRACAETYARQPGYYGATFCCGCGTYLPVGADGEFVWEGTTERVGT